MSPAPEMSPTLDEAIRALDRARAIGVISPEQLLHVCMFLDQLDNVRDVPPVVLTRDQAAMLEGAYTAGYRCADESGHVLVVSLPAMLAFAAGVPVRRPAWRDRTPSGVLQAIGTHGGLALMCAAAALAIGGQGQRAAIVGLLAVVLVIRNWATAEVERWRQRARMAEDMLGQVSARTCPISGLPSEFLRTPGGDHAG